MATTFIGEDIGQLQVKGLFLLYAPVRSATDPPYDLGDPEAAIASGAKVSGDYKLLMGLLAAGGDGDQAEPDETTIDAEFFETPFIKIPKGQPYERNFTLVKYSHEDLADFIPGSLYTPATTTTPSKWSPPIGTPIFAYEFVWGFATGKMERIFNGQVTFARTSPSDGAAGFKIKVTANANHAGIPYEEIGADTL